MKKLLSIMGVIGITASASIAVVGCSNNKNGDSNKEYNVTLNKVKNQNQKKVLWTDYSKKQSKIALPSKPDDGKIISTLAKKEIKNFNLPLTFTPYADVGIVEDTAEYLLKTAGKSGAQNQEAIEKLKEADINNIDYSLKGYKQHIGEKYQGAKIGFMQNASDTGELVPMWNAAPSKVGSNDPKANSALKGILADNGQGTEYANWFNERISNWTKEEENLTISFGPFANSFWHTAWQNNKTPEELAKIISMIGQKYNTKKFEFYFAAPYLTANGDYMDSQELLAAALKILLEQDSSYDFTLALVTSTKDGPAISNDHSSLVFGDEVSPLYTFTKYLGMNFRLNLVPYLTVSNEASVVRPELDGDWELPTIKKAIENANTVWRKIHLAVNGVDWTSNQYEETVYNRMGATPWIGRRAEKATYNFTPKDALELRKFAEDKKMGNLSMFYISRDVGSEFKKLGTTIDNFADGNALDQNIRSGSGWKQYSYSDVLSGFKSNIENTQEVKDKDGIKKIGGIDYSDVLELSKKLEDLDGGWVNPGNPTPPPTGGGQEGGGETQIPTPEPPTGPGTSLYTEWSAANPNRTNNIVEKAMKNSNVYYSPYLDAGLYQGNNVSEIYQASKLDHITLAFVQQVNHQNDTMELSIAGINKGDESYEWWKENQLWEKIISPLEKNNNFDNIKVAYGGATTGGFYEKNPWDFALTHTNNKDAAIDMLEKGLLDFQQELVDLADKKGKGIHKMPKSIDFDIEGEAQNRDEANRVLAATLAKMKKADSTWDFSLTLPVLPTGLTSVGNKVLKIFIEEYKKAGLTYQDIPVVNLMLMDYGDPIYIQAIKNGKTNFDLAKDAIEQTSINILDNVQEIYGQSINKSQALGKIGATPMIGVNDTVHGVFTLEDAKELYNYAHSQGLAYLSMWSSNDDRGKDIYSNKPINKSLLTHGLAYLREYDFARAFNGQWDEKVMRPNKN